MNVYVCLDSFENKIPVLVLLGCVIEVFLCMCVKDWVYEGFRISC